MAKQTRRPKRGRPAHLDDPPVMVGTTIPKSAAELLKELSERLNRPRSEILADAIRGYARRFEISLLTLLVGCVILNACGEGTVTTPTGRRPSPSSLPSLNVTCAEQPILRCSASIAP
jgi:hypothetical protein